MKIEFIVPGVPVSQPRPRAHVVRYGQYPKFTYYAKLVSEEDDDPVVPYKQAIRDALFSKMHDCGAMEPLTCVLRVCFEFVFPRPKAVTWKKKAMTRLPMRDVPDIDNLEKAALDALTKLAWRDDRQVCGVISEKFYGDGTEEPHTKIEIYTTQEEFDDELQSVRTGSGELQADLPGPGQVRPVEGHLPSDGG